MSLDKYDGIELGTVYEDGAGQKWEVWSKCANPTVDLRRITDGHRIGFSIGSLASEGFAKVGAWDLTVQDKMSIQDLAGRVTQEVRDEAGGMMICGAAASCMAVACDHKQPHGKRDSCDVAIRCSGGKTCIPTGHLASHAGHGCEGPAPRGPEPVVDKEEWGQVRLRNDSDPDIIVLQQHRTRTFQGGRIEDGWVDVPPSPEAGS